jgi:hypothetical protein
MPLYRFTKLPPPPELGEKTFWQYLPRHGLRRVFFLLIGLGVVLFLRSGGGGGPLGGLFDTIGPGKPKPSGPVYHIKVTRPDGTPASSP